MRRIFRFAGDSTNEHDVPHEHVAPGKRTLTTKLAELLAESAGTPRIQRKTTAAGATDAQPRHLLARAGSESGKPLPTDLAREFQGLTDSDFTGVRVHHGPAAAQASEAIGAKAFTVGQDIYFGSGAYAPSSPDGRRLLAHELAHTIQQRGAGTVNPADLPIGAAQDGAETQANEFADLLASGTPAEPRIAGTAPTHIRRDPQPNTEDHADDATTLPPPNPALAADIVALLDQIAPLPGEVPTYEVVGASTAAESSTGELTRDAMRLWRRERMSFTEAHQRVAAGEAPESSPAAPQSAHAEETESYSPRWALVLSVAHYDTMSNLPDAGRLLQAGCPFQQALHGEYANVINRPDPTGDEMYAAILDAIMGLAQASQPPQPAELLVNFQGHGGGHSISGRDGGTLNAAQMRSLASIASDNGIHMTYVLDTCNIGGIVDFAQIDRLRDTEDQLDDSGLSADDRTWARSQLQLAQRLLRIQTGLNADLGRLYGMRRTIDSTSAEDARALFQHFHDQMNQLRTLLDTLPAGAPDLTSLAIPLVAPWANSLIAVRTPPSRASHRHLRASSATLLDTMNDAVSDILNSVRERMAN